MCNEWKFVLIAFLNGLSLLESHYMLLLCKELNEPVSSQSLNVKEIKSFNFFFLWPSQINLKYLSI